jgi:hypothetical protein
MGHKVKSKPVCLKKNGPQAKRSRFALIFYHIFFGAILARLRALHATPTRTGDDTAAAARDAQCLNRRASSGSGRSPLALQSRGF